ncbi:NAD(P)H-binding protein [Thalassospira alkalitolerans]|uniref:NAD(P)H-binding protein n=1 Tax=Thalassospira alkalitolerans TaxID=1293890 RepID=UPI0030EE744D|tara:strand:- start:1140 stop:2000 length:861 start_codon:yes stop_codon:yes gene_type:complete
MFIITGANGQLGHAIVKKILGFVSADQVAAICRDPQKAADLCALGVQVRPGDFDKPESLSRAFEGASQVLIVSSNARAYGGDPLIQHQNAIDAARAAGAARIVYTSHMAASAHSAFPPMHDHAATEKMLQDCGVVWTALRHGFYASSAIAVIRDALETGVIETAADGPVSWVAHDDLAEAAAIILSQVPDKSGPTSPLAPTQSFDFKGLARLASDFLGKPIHHKIIADDDMRAKLAGRGIPAHVANIILGRDIAARNGEFATVDPTLKQILGRSPISMRDLIAEQI